MSPIFYGIECFDGLFFLSGKSLFSSPPLPFWVHIFNDRDGLMPLSLHFFFIELYLPIYI